MSNGIRQDGYEWYTGRDVFLVMTFSDLRDTTHSEQPVSCRDSKLASKKRNSGALSLR
jgi:hypothetical protein